MFFLLLAPPDPILAHAIAEWRRTPAMRAQDAYKWLYQATMGGEHAILDAEGPRSWLDAEWKAVGAPLKGEAMIEKLMPDGSIVRVNLRPYKAGGGDKGALLKAFVASAKEYKPNLRALKAFWSEVVAGGATRRIRRSDLRTFDRLIRKDGYPSVHHSASYEKAYKPAYRVITGREWKRLVKTVL